MIVRLPESPEHILLVDDNPNNLRLLSPILSQRGFHLRAATSGPRALASIEAAPPDLILLDIRMPGMDGYEVCQRLKSDPRTRDIPILFISALDDIHDKVRAFSAGGVDYITKPFQLEEVIARVETHLALRRLQRRLQAANERMEEEMALAAQVQASFMRRSLPVLPGWQISAVLMPAQTTSGDFFDTLQLPGGALGLLIADVVHKGVGAALFMAMSFALLRAYLQEHASQPDAAFAEVNRRILEDTTANQFVTTFLGVLDTHSGRLTYSNAGHNPPLLVRASAGGAPEMLLKTGPALGVLDDGTWERRSVHLQPGDSLVMYTDGIPEAENAAEDFYGLDRLVAAVQQNLGAGAEGMRQAIVDSVHGFAGGVAQSDDIALIVLSRDA